MALKAAISCLSFPILCYKKALQKEKLRVGHVHLTLNEVIPLRNTNRSYAWLVRAAVARHS